MGNPFCYDGVTNSNWNPAQSKQLYLNRTQIFSSTSLSYSNPTCLVIIKLPIGSGYETKSKWNRIEWNNTKTCVWFHLSNEKGKETLQANEFGYLWGK